MQVLKIGWEGRDTGTKMEYMRNMRTSQLENPNTRENEREKNGDREERLINHTEKVHQSMLECPYREQTGNTQLDWEGGKAPTMWPTVTTREYDDTPE